MREGRVREQEERARCEHEPELERTREHTDYREEDRDHGARYVKKASAAARYCAKNWPGSRWAYATGAPMLYMSVKHDDLR